MLCIPYFLIKRKKLFGRPNILKSLRNITKCNEISFQFEIEESKITKLIFYRFLSVNMEV